MRILKNKTLLTLAFCAALNALAVGSDEGDDNRALQPIGSRAAAASGTVFQTNADARALEIPTALVESIQQAHTWREAFARPEMRQVLLDYPFPLDFMRLIMQQGGLHTLPASTYAADQMDESLFGGGTLNSMAMAAFADWDEEYEVVQKRLAGIFITPATLHEVFSATYKETAFPYVPNGIAQLFILHHVEAFLGAYAQNVVEARRSATGDVQWRGLESELRTLTYQFKKVIAAAARNTQNQYIDAARACQQQSVAITDAVMQKQEEEAESNTGVTVAGSVMLDPLLKPFSGRVEGILAGLPMKKINELMRVFQEKYGDRPAPLEAATPAIEGPNRNSDA